MRAELKKVREDLSAKEKRVKSLQEKYSKQKLQVHIRYIFYLMKHWGKVVGGC